MAVKSNDRFTVFYKNEVYDISDFRKKHPGGLNTLNGMLNTDISYKFENAPPHSDAARYLMKEYRIRTSTDKNDNEINESKKLFNLNEDPREETDDSMEHLVDWSKAMLPQIKNLGRQYDDWVHKPVDRSLRLFKQDYLEILTKTPWWLVPTYWIPIIILLIYLGVNDAYGRDYNNTSVIFNILIGIFLWTVIEYSLHRWVFHLNAANASAFLCTFHFMLHGLHHKVPFDPNRLVFPPFPATILAVLFYQPLLLLCSFPKLVLSGGLLGYLCYDMIHYYIHHGSPTGGYLYHMKRYHYQHHFVSNKKGFGISTPMWDEAFGTKIILKKLKYLLKW